jgi:serine/threonine protein kinase
VTASHTIVAGRYRLLRQLGHGGMGRVWLAEDDKLNRTVALKEILPDGQAADVQELGPRAFREARAAARLHHPNVIRVYDIVVVDGTPWIVMQYVPSRSLFQIVSQDGPLAPTKVAQIGLGVLAALRAAHAMGVLHRDVKPGNVLIGTEGQVVLTDFGVATVVGDPAITRSGLIIGSPSYMSPERAADRPIGPAADLWSLGATLYFAAEGRSPFERSSVLATLAALANEEPPPARRAGALQPVINGLLRKDPGARMSAAEAERRLQAIAAGAAPVAAPAAKTTVPPPLAWPASSPRTVSLPQPRRRPALVWLVAVLAAMAALLLWGTREVPEGNQGTISGAPPARSMAPQPTTPPSTARPPTSPPATLASLPEGWHWYTDPTGFTVAVPQSWTISRRGSIVYFSEPGGGRLLGIDQTNRPKPDPVADWRTQESYRVARGDFPDYHRIRLEAVDYFDKAADWEFTYVRDGVRLHVNNRGFITAPDQAYGMWWSTPDSQWQSSLRDRQLIEQTFRPRR